MHVSALVACYSHDTTTNGVDERHASGEAARLGLLPLFFVPILDTTVVTSRLSPSLSASVN
jgi:hypothetical protein